jgi:hypothetical protein
VAVGARTPKISASGVTAVVGATATQLHLALQQRHIELEQLRRELQHERALWMRNQQQEEDQLHEQLACVLKVGLGDGPSAASMTTAPTAEGVALPKGQVAETVTLLMKLFGRLVEGEALGEVPHRALATEAEGVLHAAVQQLQVRLQAWAIAWGAVAPTAPPVLSHTIVPRIELRTRTGAVRRAQWAEHLAKNAPRKGELDASLHELYSERAKLMAALRTVRVPLLPCRWAEAGSPGSPSCPPCCSPSAIPRTESPGLSADD